MKRQTLFPFYFVQPVHYFMVIAFVVSCSRREEEKTITGIGKYFEVNEIMAQNIKLLEPS